MMNSSKAVPRCIGRKGCNGRTCVRSRRFQSTNASSSTTKPTTGTSHALIGGLAGAGAASALGYAWYHFSGVKTVVNAASQTKRYYESATSKLKEQSPEPNQALQWLRETSLSYAAFIPGGKKYVETALNDLDAIHDKHGDKVDKILRETYTEIRDATNSQGISIETAQQVWSIIEKRLSEVAELGVDASDTIFKNHPDLKEKVGGRVDELKSMRDRYGPEVKEQIDKTWDEVRSVVNKGLNTGTVNEIRNIIEEKTKAARKLADSAFDKGLQEARPYLEKSPKVKELVEENNNALKQGDITQLWQKIKDSASSGDTSDLEQYVKQSIDKARSNSSAEGDHGLESVLRQIPGAESIGPSISKLIEIGHEHGHEAKELLNSTIKEIEQVLRKKVSEAEKITQTSKKES